MLRKGSCLLFLCMIFLLFSCNLKKEGLSFNALLEAADSQITTGDAKSVVRTLRSARDSAQSPLQFLGIYKRLLQVGELQEAEKTLKAGIRQHPDNLDLKAVYSWFLYEHESLSQALGQAKKLENTKYASLLSQFQLQAAKEKGSVDYLSPDYADVYASAYLSTQNDAWLQNAAVVCAATGNFDQALHYGSVAHLSDPLFWATAAYDGKRYSEALDYLALLGTSHSAESLLLASDIHTIMGDLERGRRAREALLTLGEQELPAQLYLNGAKDARSSKDLVLESLALNRLLELYPDNEEGLRALMEMALRVQQVPEENDLAKALRETKLRSAGMIAYDMLPKTSPEQVLDLMAASHQRTNSAHIAALAYAYRINPAVSPNMTQEEKEADLWLLLEAYGGGTAEGSEKLVEIAVPALISLGHEREARRIFDASLMSRFGTNDYKELQNKLSVKECECAAYFSAQGAGGSVDMTLSRDLFESLLSDQSLRFPQLASTSSYEVEIPVLVNLGEMYAGSKKYSQAWDVYTQAAGLASTAKEKADILYRLAWLQYQTGFSQEAGRSLESCLKYNPYHQDAKILQLKAPNLGK